MIIDKDILWFNISMDNTCAVTDNQGLGNIRSQTDRLNSLTADMLMLAKMDEGRDSGVPAEEFDAGEVLGDVLRTFRESAEVRGVRITRKVDGDCRIRYRRDAYIRLLSILFENAVKYVRENGFIEAGAMREGRRITVFVRNDCDALPDCPPERLFDRFFRADQSRTRATGGSGIGLSSAKAIAEQGGGTLTAGYEDGNVIVFRLNIESVT
jgi:signal transduction histidine kinase